MNIGLWLSGSIGSSGQTCWLQDFHAYYLYYKNSYNASFYLMGLTKDQSTKYFKKINKGDCSWIIKMLNPLPYEGQKLDLTICCQSGSMHADIDKRVNQLLLQVSQNPHPVVWVDTDGDHLFRSGHPCITKYFRDNAADQGISSDILKYTSVDKNEKFLYTPYCVSPFINRRPFNSNPSHFTFFAGSYARRGSVFYQWIVDCSEQYRLPSLIYGIGWPNAPSSNYVKTHGTTFFDFTGDYFDIMNKSFVQVDIVGCIKNTPIDYIVDRTVEHYYAGTPNLGRYISDERFSFMPNWHPEVRLSEVNRQQLYDDYEVVGEILKVDSYADELLNYALN